MFDRIVSHENVETSLRKTMKGDAKYRIGSILFHQNITQNLEKLVNEIKDQTFIPSGYNEFYVYEPKERLILAPKYRDKIVHHMVNNVLRDYYEPKFIYDSYACIRNKGHRKAVRRLRYFAMRAARTMNDPYVVNVDVKKFFYSIDREVLKDVLRMRITCQSTLSLLIILIDSSPGERGLPLGNLSSQLLANILMNEIDQYAKHYLKCKFYLRYCDDMIVVVEGKDEATRIKNALCGFLSDVLRMSAHPKKSSIYKLSLGLSSLGMRVYPDGKVVLPRSVKKRCMRKIKRAVMNEDVPAIHSIINHMLIAT